MKHLHLIILAALVAVASANAAEEGKHLFILSGQSNMANLAPNVSFTPAVEAAFGKDNVIVVKDAGKCPTSSSSPSMTWDSATTYSGRFTYE